MHHKMFGSVPSLDSIDDSSIRIPKCDNEKYIFTSPNIPSAQNVPLLPRKRNKCFRVWKGEMKPLLLAED